MHYVHVSFCGSVVAVIVIFVYHGLSTYIGYYAGGPLHALQILRTAYLVRLKMGISLAIISKHSKLNTKFYILQLH